MRKTQEFLNGAWEELGVIGKRVEIDGSAITVLWRGAPVLETTFKLHEADGQTQLVLKKNGLRYANAVTDYASIRQIVYTDDVLTLVEDFPITGESRTALTRTENTRYGNYEIADEILPQLQGTWKTADGRYELHVKKDVLCLNGAKTRIHVLRSKSSCEPQGRYEIASVDPSADEWQGFGRFIYENGTLSALLRVCDAPSVPFVFEKTS